MRIYDISTGLTRRRSAADLGATPSFHRLLSRPVALGNPLGTHWGPLGDPLGTLGDPLGIPWGPLGDPWGPLGIPRGSLGDHLETSGDVLGCLADALAIPWGPLTRIFGHFRCLLGILWGHIGPPRGSHSLPKGVQEASWGALGIILEAAKGFRKQFAAICKNLQIYCKVLQNSRSRESEIVPNQVLFCSKSSPNC